MAKKIFLSYRRSDTSGDSGRIYDRLEAAFPGALFRDRETIPLGQDFRVEIEQALRQTAALVLLIGPDWLKGRRLDAPDDPVRFEILTALRYGATIIPVLVRGASMPAADQLPRDLQFLVAPNALFIHDDDFDRGIERLTERLEQIVGRRRPRKSHSWGRTLRWVTASGLVATCGTVLFFGWVFQQVRGAAEAVRYFDPPVEAAGPPVAFDFEPAGSWRIQLVGEAPVGGLLTLSQNGTYGLGIYVGAESAEAARGRWSYEAATRTIRLEGSSGTSPHRMTIRVTRPAGANAYEAVQDDALRTRLVRAPASQPAQAKTL